MYGLPSESHVEALVSLSPKYGGVWSKEVIKLNVIIRSEALIQQNQCLIRRDTRELPPTPTIPPNCPCTKERSHIEPTQAAACKLKKEGIYQKQNGQKLDLGLPVYVILLWQPKKTNTIFLFVLIIKEEKLPKKTGQQKRAGILFILFNNYIIERYRRV